MISLLKYHTNAVMFLISLHKIWRSEVMICLFSHFQRDFLDFTCSKFNQYLLIFSISQRRISFCAAWFSCFHTTYVVFWISWVQNSIWVSRFSQFQIAEFHFVLYWFSSFHISRCDFLWFTFPLISWISCSVTFTFNPLHWFSEFRLSAPCVCTWPITNDQTLRT